ncbi:MAG: RDD family protein [Nanoarchaeota archaeon]|nr:RDD family protein [Nanoarchaeota archaeon]
MSLNLPQERVFAASPPLWKRFVAFLADLFILDAVIGSPFQRVVPAMTGGFGDTMEFLNARPDIAVSLSLVMLAYGLLAVLYFSILEYRLGATPGKMLFGISVRGEEQRFSPYILRNLPMLLIFPFFILLFIDVVYILVRKDSRRLSELISRTSTVQYYAL